MEALFWPLGAPPGNIPPGCTTHLRVPGDELQRGHLRHHDWRREQRVEGDAEEDVRGERLRAALHARTDHELAEEQLEGRCGAEEEEETDLFLCGELAKRPKLKHLNVAHLIQRV